jgi:hypothetical protein
MGSTSSSPSPDFTVTTVAGKARQGGFVEGIGSRARFAFPSGVSCQFDAKTDARFRAIDLNSGASTLCLWLLLDSCFLQTLDVLQVLRAA